MLLAAVFSSVFCAASQIITEVETEEISRLSVAMEASEAEAVITLVSALDFVSTRHKWWQLLFGVEILTEL